MTLRTIDDVNFSGKKVLLRVDFNVPVKEGKISDETRINAALPTIEKVLKDGGKLIIMSHFGRPKSGYEEKFSLHQIKKRLAEVTNTVVNFNGFTIGNEAEKMSNDLNPGEIYLLENTRFFEGETKGDKDFAEKLSKLGDIYINDAFGAAHRAHASTTTVAYLFPPDYRIAGKLMESEIKNAEKVLLNHQKPFTAILGGAKVSDKINLIEQLTEKADNILIGGGMAYTFIKSEGGEIGNSLFEKESIPVIEKIKEIAEKNNCRLILPEDSIIADSFSETASVKTVKSKEIPENWMGLDIGPESRKTYSEIILESKTILWNGPMGVFEMEPFQHGTAEIAKKVAEATENGCFSLVGGGDSVSAVKKFKLEEKISYISTGGGALLEFFEGKKLPGIIALTNE